MIAAVDGANATQSSAFPSLLSPLTSIPMHSLPRYFVDNRLENDLYSILLQRKLRLPVFPSSAPPTCRYCSRQCDLFSDHLFSCKFLKTPLHNAIQNTMYTLLSTLALMVGLARSKFDVLLEPTNLLPQHPLCRLADIAINLQAPTAAKSTILAIDITITSVLPHLPSQPQLNNPLDIPEAHLRSIRSIRSKLSGHTHGFLSNQEVITAINRKNITLLPFTVDHLGGLGFFSYSLLFGKDSPFPRLPLPNFTADRLPHPEAFSAYQTLLNGTAGFLQKTNKAWEDSPCRRLRFGSTYHTSSPQECALQCLVLYICPHHSEITSSGRTILYCISVEDQLPYQ
jgi:hypothetical protein